MRSTHSKPTSVILAQCFLPCLAIYRKVAFFTTWANITATRHNIAKPDFCQYRALFSHAIRCNESRHIRCAPIWWQAHRSGDTMSQPASQWQANDLRQPIGTRHNQTKQRDASKGADQTTQDRHRDSKESLCGWRLTAWVDYPHSPNSRASQIQKLLFLYTNP
jgi:protein involved in temperature-dependent protein secretion